MAKVLKRRARHTNARYIRSLCGILNEVQNFQISKRLNSVLNIPNDIVKYILKELSRKMQLIPINFSKKFISIPFDYLSKMLSIQLLILLVLYS